MTEKKDPNAWIEKEKQQIKEQVVKPMRKQIEQALKQIYLDAAKRYSAVKSGNDDAKPRKPGEWRFMDIYDDQDWVKEELGKFLAGEAYDLAESCATHIQRDYSGWWSSFVDMITAGENREEREEREWYHRLHDWD